jgi:MFS family permease
MATMTWYMLGLENQAMTVLVALWGITTLGMLLYALAGPLVDRLADRRDERDPEKVGRKARARMLADYINGKQ